MVIPRAGFTITEVIVALNLLAVAALGVAATALVAAQSFARAEVQERALREAEHVLDSLLMVPISSPGTRRVGPAHIIWPAADTSGSVSVHITFDGRTTTLVGAR